MLSYTVNLNENLGSCKGGKDLGEQEEQKAGYFCSTVFACRETSPEIHCFSCIFHVSLNSY